MTIMTHRGTRRFSLLDAMQARIGAYLQRHFETSEGVFGNLDEWTRRRVADENLAKLALVLEADQPAEACYRDLIREIDAEAQTGIYLARSDADMAHLRIVAGEPGVSGRLYREMPAIAPKVFRDEAAHSTDDLDLVWVTVRACHDRAHVDATLSQIIMSYLVDDGDSVLDMSNAMRALQYPFHEDLVRRRCDLPLLLGDREHRELEIMVADLADRAGSYDERTRLIRQTADAF